MSCLNSPTQSQNDARYATPNTVSNAITAQAMTDAGQYAQKSRTGNRAVGQGELCVSIRDYGAVGDGSTDDTAAINAALASGALNVYVPDGIYAINAGGRVAFAVNNQCLHGPGTLKQTNTSFTSGVVYANQLSGIVVENITIIASGSYQGSGILMIDCSGFSIRNCKVSNHGYGIYLYSNGGVGNTYFDVSGNQFSGATINPNWNQSSSSDIYVLGNAANGLITRNRHNSNGGYGISLEAYNTTDIINRISIVQNVITGYNSYGIMLYRNGPYVQGATAAVQHCIIANNIVNQISGSRSRTPGGTDLVFGAGIYVQGAEDCTVNANKISNTNTATTTNSLAPGAIGVGSTGRCIISNNEITSPSQYGIIVADSLYNGYQPGAINIDGNLIQGAGVNGIYVVSRSQVYIRSNSIIGVTNHGIATTSSVANLHCEDILIENNGISGCGGNGILSYYADKVSIRGNKIDGRVVSTASLVATVSGGVVTQLQIGDAGQPGSFSTAPTIISNSINGTGFSATITISGGQLSSPIITSGGQNYSGPPSIHIVGGLGRGGLHGIDVAQCQDVWVEGNDIIYMNGRGIDMEASNNTGNNPGVNYVVSNNVAKYCSINYQFDCATYADNNQSFNASTADYAGACNPYSLTSTLATATSAIINVANYREITLTPTSTVTYTALQNGAYGQILTLYAGNSNVTITNNASIRLSGSANFSMSSGSTLTLKFINNVWSEISRSA